MMEKDTLFQVIVNQAEQAGMPDRLVSALHPKLILFSIGWA